MNNSLPLMRPLFALGLLVGSLGLSECKSSLVKTSATTSGPAKEQVIASNAGVATAIEPGPDPAHRSARPENVVSESTVYAATLPVLDDQDGIVQIRVTVNPQTHKLNKTQAIFAPHKGAVSYKQIGDGVGHYDAKTGRYYFNVGYQKVRKLDDGRTDNGNLMEIDGWVHPETSSAGVVSRES